MPHASQPADVPGSDLPPELASLLVRLATGWSPAPFRPGPIVRLVVDGQRVIGEGTDGVSTGLSVGRGTLTVETVGPPPSLMADLLVGAAQFGSVEGDFENGVPINGRGTKNMRRYLSAAAKVESEIVVEDWTAWGSESRFAVSRIGASGPDAPIGNLVLWTTGPGGSWSSSIGHLVLHTAYTYYLVAHRPRQRPGDVTWWLVVDPGDHALDTKRITSDLVAFRFALATSFDTHTFSGVDDDGQTVGGFGLDTRQVAGRISNSVEPPVPSQTQFAWAAPFVESLVATVPAEGASPVSVALDRYDQSVRALDVDNQFLHVVGAIATLARSVADADERSLVESSESWEAWVETSSEAIRDLAAVGGGDALIEAVRTAARPPTGDVVADVYSRFGFEGGGAVGVEVERSREVYLRGSLVPVAEQGRASALQGYDRVQALRRAFGALVAAEIGYDGQVSHFAPLTDPDVPEPVVRVSERPIRPSVREQAMARTTAVAEVRHGLMTDWPTYEAPSLPDDARIQALDVYAGRLEARTGGEVAASLRPLPRPPRRGTTPSESGDQVESRPMSFRLHLARYPETQTALFSAELVEERLVIQGWGADDIILPDVEAVQSFLMTVAESDEVRYRVQQLLSIADERARVRASDDIRAARPTAEREFTIPIPAAPEGSSGPDLAR